MAGDAGALPALDAQAIRPEPLQLTRLLWGIHGRVPVEEIERPNRGVGRKRCNGYPPAGVNRFPPSHPATTMCTAIAPVTALRAMPGAPQKGARLNRRAPSQAALFARNARLIVLRHQCQSDPSFQRQRIQVVLGRRRMLLAVGIDADHARRHTGAYQRIPDRGSALGR